MAVEIDGKIYYRTAEICQKAGISRATLFRWLKAGVLKKTFRDREDGACLPKKTSNRCVRKLK